ncbi:MAG TPA: hypothetical protein VF784_12235 [Anaerolineales bacterium]
MATIAAILSKAWLVVTLALTGITSSLPAPVQALVPSATPAPQTATASYPRLQRAWEREQTVYGRLGKFFDNIDQRITRGQALIDKARANGKDVSALQAALNVFSTAVKQARPAYESIKGIVASHAGFDDQGSVVDPVKAFQTVLEMRLKLTEIRGMILPPARALRQAFQDFRQVNQPTATPTP